MSEEAIQGLATLSKKIGVTLPANWRGIDAIWPIIEMIRRDGGVVIIKADGLRTSEEDNGAYTVVISGGGLKGDYVTAERKTLEQCLEHCLCEYIARCWL